VGRIDEEEDRVQRRVYDVYGMKKPRLVDDSQEKQNGVVPEAEDRVVTPEPQIKDLRVDHVNGCLDDEAAGKHDP
jgi:hypothetical protein